MQYTGAISTRDEEEVIAVKDLLIDFDATLHTPLCCKLNPTL